MNAILMAVWRRKPTHEVIIYSDQGSQLHNNEWKSLLENNRLISSMSRRVTVMKMPQPKSSSSC